MLDGLDLIDWGNLEHAYGPADDVPDLIRGLASKIAETREHARDELWCNVIHQGTVYSVTSYAVPFLLELLESPAVKDKAQLLVYVAALACGNSYLDVHQDLFREMGVDQEERDPAEWHEQIERELGWVEAARSAVVSGTPVYLTLLDDPDPEIRCCAAYTLAVGKPRAAEIVLRLEDRLKLETDEGVKASILLSLPCVGGSDCGPLIERYLDLAHGRLVRVAAALSLVQIAGERVPRAAVKELLESIADPEAIDPAYRKLPWADGESVVSAVSAALSRLSTASVETTVPLMLDALDGLRSRDAASITMVGAILSIVFDVRKEPREPGELSELQRTVVRRLARSNPAWSWGNVSWTFREFGLPDSRVKMKEFVREI
jgi:hypothetical protein